MLVFVGKGYDFCFDAWAVSWTNAFDLSVVQRRVGQAFFQDFMNFRVGECNPTRQLGQRAGCAHKRKVLNTFVSGLHLHLVEVYTSAIDSNWGARFHSVCADAPSRDTFRKVEACRFCASATRNLCATDVHQSVQECAGGDDYTSGMKNDIHVCLHTGCLAVFYQQFLYLVLPDVQIGLVFQNLSPCPNEFTSVTLCSRTPHSGTLASVKHAELYGGLVCHQSHLSA